MRRKHRGSHSAGGDRPAADGGPPRTRDKNCFCNLVGMPCGSKPVFGLGLLLADPVVHPVLTVPGLKDERYAQMLVTLDQAAL